MVVRRTLVGVVVTVGLVLSVGCDRAFTAERLYWKSVQSVKQVLKGGEAPRPEVVARAIERFQQLVDRYPGSSVAPDAQFRIAQLRVVQRDHPRAREAFQTVILNYSGKQGLALQARYAIGLSYEAEGDWEAAEHAYEELAYYHPISTLGLHVPLYIAQHYEKAEQPEQAQIWLERGRRGYEKIVRDAAVPQVAALAQRFTAESYILAGDWPAATGALQELIQRYPDAPQVWEARLTMGVLYEKKMNDAAQARAAYAAFLDAYPQHQLAAQVRDHLATLAASGTDAP